MNLCLMRNFPITVIENVYQCVCHYIVVDLSISKFISAVK